MAEEKKIVPEEEKEKLDEHAAASIGWGIASLVSSAVSAVSGIIGKACIETEGASEGAYAFGWFAGASGIFSLFSLWKCGDELSKMEEKAGKAERIIKGDASGTVDDVEYTVKDA